MTDCMNAVTTSESMTTSPTSWRDGVTRYQWLVLTIASLGRVFDVFEGQIFVSSMNEAMPSLLPKEISAGDLAFYNNVALSSFLVGGALGGVLFGIVADRVGRSKMMILTILLYSLFTCVTAFAQTWWQIAILRGAGGRRRMGRGERVRLRSLPKACVSLVGRGVSWQQCTRHLSDDRGASIHRQQPELRLALGLRHQCVSGIVDVVDSLAAEGAEGVDRRS